MPTDTSEIESQLTDVVQMTRRIYVQVLQAALGASNTHGTCLYACLLLKGTIERFTPLQAEIQGGDGAGNGGYFDLQGVGHGHYWVRATWSGRAWVACITSDQFGGPGVVVLRQGAASSHYRPGDQALVDRHVAEHAIHAG